MFPTLRRSPGFVERFFGQAVPGMHLDSSALKSATDILNSKCNLEFMRLSHINVTMLPGGEDTARAFYAGLLGLPEISKPESIRSRGGVWFDAGGLDVHVSVEENRFGPDVRRHFGLECANVEKLRAQLEAAGVKTEDGRPAPWKRFFVNDPFGNRIEIHETGGLRA
jgi:catechol 2,3-dioxygenase-like lactoylglutathione lyase family enzyme